MRSTDFNQFSGDRSATATILLFRADEQHPELRRSHLFILFLIIYAPQSDIWIYETVYYWFRFSVLLEFFFLSFFLPQSKTQFPDQLYVHTPYTYIIFYNKHRIIICVLLMAFTHALNQESLARVGGPFQRPLVRSLLL